MEHITYGPGFWIVLIAVTLLAAAIILSIRDAIVGIIRKVFGDRPNSKA